MSASNSQTTSQGLSNEHAVGRITTAPWRYGRALYLAVNIAVLIFLLAPIAIVIVFALNPTPFIQFPPIGVSLRWFEKFFASREFMHALGFSLEIAALTTACASVLGLISGQRDLQ